MVVTIVRVVGIEEVEDGWDKGGVWGYLGRLKFVVDIRLRFFVESLLARC